MNNAPPTLRTSALASQGIVFSSSLGIIGSGVKTSLKKRNIYASNASVPYRRRRRVSARCNERARIIHPARTPAPLQVQGAGRCTSPSPPPPPPAAADVGRCCAAPVSSTVLAKASRRVAWRSEPRERDASGVPCRAVAWRAGPPAGALAALQGPCCCPGCCPGSKAVSPVRVSCPNGAS